MLQQQALELLKSGANVFITGSAGSGKTYLLNQFIDYLRQYQVPVGITASTGIAATHIGGQTIHSFTSLGVRDHIGERELEQIKSRHPVSKRLRAIKVLIVDEISMLAGNTLANVDSILRYVRAHNQAFGGVQLVLCGDFFQLPPVSRSGQDLRSIIAFMHPVWLSAKLKICYLTEQHRQSESRLLRLLNEMRLGAISSASTQALQHKLNSEPASEAKIKLYTHNVDVDSYNLSQLAGLEGDSELYSASTSGANALVEQLRRSVLAPALLELKTGARVMFVKNNYDRGHFNGSLGVVRGFTREEKWPVVDCANGLTITAEPAEWSIENEYGEKLASYSQIPLRLAWAITVHKSQGMTLDSAELDLSKCFESGQGYVALSRLRAFSELQLSGINDQALEMNQLVRRADQRFQALSEDNLQAWQALSPQQQQQQIQQAQRRLGAITPKANQADSKPSKPSTYELTLELVEQGLSLEAIAQLRELTIGTIIGHLRHLRQQDPELDLSAYQPDEAIVAAVAGVLAQHHPDVEPDYYDQRGRLRLGIIYTDLEQKYSYEQLNLALLFVDG